MAVKKMKKSDFIKAVASKSGVTITEATNVLNGVNAALEEAFNSKEAVTVADAVTLTPTDKPATSGVMQGKSWSKPAHTTIKATVAKKYKQL